MLNGYSRCKLHTYTFARNPYPYVNKPEKPAADVKTLTKTVQMNWDMADSDRVIEFSVDHAPKAMRDSLKALYEANDTPAYVFVDPYGVSWLVTFRKFIEETSTPVGNYHLKITLRVLEKLS